MSAMFHRRARLLHLALLATLLTSGCAKQSTNHSAETHPAEGGKTTKDGRLSPLLGNLGKFQRKTSTASADAQRYFTQGLTLIYGFNHAEAVRSFQEAARNDAKLGMAYWGEALAVGPNINDAAKEPDREKQAYEAARKAVANKAGMTELEQALIDAIAVRFSDPAGNDREKRMNAYAAEMEKVYQRFPDDPDVGVLYSSAVMDTMPWNYYLPGGQPKPPIIKVVAALEKAMQSAPDHPGAHHYYIHAVEASPNPDRAVPSADKLGGLVPGAGHLVHMPSHIYIRVGRYDDGTQVNIKAIAADEDYITQCRIQGIYPAAYYPHNIHFLTATLAMAGRSKEMLDASKKVSGQHGHDMMTMPGFGLPHMLKGIPVLGMVRFGKWDEILALSKPEDSDFVLAMWHYGRGMAFARKGDAKSADTELAALRVVAAKHTLKELTVFDINNLASIAAIAVDVLDGEVAAQKKNYARAVASLKRAVAREDALQYIEPPDWPNPARHNLGAVLLSARKPAEAEKVFRQDLERHRGNGWSLMGLYKSLEAQGKKDEATGVKAQFDKAWSRADTKIESSAL